MSHARNPHSTAPAIVAAWPTGPDWPERPHQPAGPKAPKETQETVYYRMSDPIGPLISGGQ